MTKSQLLFWVLVAFVIGVVVASAWPLRISAIAAFFLPAAAAGFFALLDWQARRTLLVAAALIFAASAGAFRAAFGADHRIDRSFVPGRRVSVHAVVAEEPVRRAFDQRFRVRIKGSGAELLIFARPYPRYQSGELLLISGALRRPDAPLAPAGRVIAPDRADLLVRNPSITVLGSGDERLARALGAVRERFVGALGRALPEPHASFVTGLVAGGGRGFPADLARDMRRSGTTHLVALSGYNVTIIAASLLAAFSFLPLPPAAALLCAALGVAIFAIATGASASVVRAAIMGLLVLLARRAGRRAEPRILLALAAFGMLAYDPRLAVFDIGFQLSFLATLGLVYGVPALEPAWERSVRFLRSVAIRLGVMRPFLRGSGERSGMREIALATVAAQLAVLPIIVARFGMLSLASPVANLAVIPAVPATMLFGFLAGAAGMIAPVLAVPFAWVAWALAAYELAAIRMFARIPGAAVALPPTSWPIAVVIYALGAIALWRARRLGLGA